MFVGAIGNKQPKFVGRGFMYYPAQIAVVLVRIVFDAGRVLRVIGEQICRPTAMLISIRQAEAVANAINPRNERAEKTELSSPWRPAQWEDT